jgi:hypothetical protein
MPDAGCPKPILMRLDRLLTLYFFHPLRKILGQKEGPRISILMYHSISNQDDPGRHPYFQTNTKPEIFARQMQFLADNDYKVISLTDAVSLLSIVLQPAAGSPTPDTLPLRGMPESGSRKPEAGSPKPHKYCVLTFDD